MSRFIKRALAALACAALPALAAPGLGRPATPAELAAWDIDVRADFKGLPPGAGTALQGQQIWEARCASCHGAFGESNEVFTPIVGGTTAEDIKTGRVASLTSGKQPHKTTLMKVPTISTLWDYIHRAMPWNAPKSLSVNDVYAVTAYILNLGEIVGDDFELSNRNIAEVQQRMPNRNGMTNQHGLWDVKGKPDVHSVACMKDCPVEATIRSRLPDASRNSHGNLAQQNRLVGATVGAQTSAPVVADAAGLVLARQYNCLACHGVKGAIVGPGFNAVAARYAGTDAAPALAAKINKGGSGNWGAIPMPPQSEVKEQDIQTLVGWILAGAK
ncbi:MAG: c-type cytochrome [Pseudomonadota bacterium]